MHRFADTNEVIRAYISTMQRKSPTKTGARLRAGQGRGEAGRRRVHAKVHQGALGASQGYLTLTAAQCQRQDLIIGLRTKRSSSIPSFLRHPGVCM